jgi:hypothetical protein
MNPYRYAFATTATVKNKLPAEEGNAFAASLLRCTQTSTLA